MPEDHDIEFDPEDLPRIIHHLYELAGGTNHGFSVAEIGRYIHGHRRVIKRLKKDMFVIGKVEGIIFDMKVDMASGILSTGTIYQKLYGINPKGSIEVLMGDGLFKGAHTTHRPQSSIGFTSLGNPGIEPLFSTSYKGWTPGG